MVLTRTTLRRDRDSDQKNKQGPPPHPYVPRNGTGRAGGKPPTARGHVKKVKGKKGKKGKKDQYDLIVNIDLTEWQLTEEQVSDFKEVFMLFDKDEDGVLTFPELNVVMKSLGQRPSEKELLTMVRAVSEDQIYDTIEFNEFLQMMSKQQKDGLNEGALKDAFRIFDKDDDGFISVDELRHIMQSLGEKLTDNELDDMIGEADSDKDGLINYQEFVHVLCSEKVGEGNKKKPAAKKNKKDRKTREKSKDNKENQQQMDGLLKGEKPKESIVIIENQPSSSAHSPTGGSHGHASCRPKDFLTNVITINNQVPGMPAIPPISPILSPEPTQATSPTFRLTSPLPIISNIATAIVNTTGKKVNGTKNGLSRSPAGSPINDEPSPTPSSLINPSSLTSSNKDRSTAVKKGYKQSDQSTTMTNNLTSPPASSQQMDTLNSGKHIRGSISASSINNNHRQAVLMACDNVALVVRVNPNERPRGGPPSTFSPPYISSSNAINNNTDAKPNTGSRNGEEEGRGLKSNNRMRHSGAMDSKTASTENGGLIPNASNRTPTGSCNSVKTSPHRKIIAK